MGKRIQGRHILIISIALIVIVTIFAYLIYSGVFLDYWEQRDIIFDVDNDGNAENITLSNRKMTVRRNDKIIWESNNDWKVVDFLIGDINKDAKDEFLLLVWKRGSYGEYTPFWDENDRAYSQHIFIFQWTDERLDPIWMSSKLIPQVKSWNLMEDDEIYIITDSDEETIWIWGKWGLERWK